MKRRLLVASSIVVLTATTSLLTHAQGARVAAGSTARSRETAVVPVTDEVLRSPAAADWPAWRRDRAGTGYSPLDEINRRNVGHLRLAWAATLEPGSLEP